MSGGCATCKQADVTTIYVTHDQNEAMEISDKIIVINKGRVEQIGAARDVYEEPSNKFVASFIGNINIIDAHLEGDAILCMARRPGFTGPPVTMRRRGILFSWCGLKISGFSMMLRGLMPSLPWYRPYVIRAV